MSAQADRIDRTETALAGTVVVEQLQRSFPIDDRRSVVARIVNAAIPWAPMLLLKPNPEKRGTGVGSFVAKPQVWSFALVAGIVAAKEIAERKPLLALARNIPELDVGRRYKLQLLNGADPEKVEWASDNEGIAVVERGGVVRAVGGGNSATITVRAGDQEDSVVVRVR